MQETYPYYSLPYCKPEHGIEVKKRPSGIGEILEGNMLHNSGLKLHFPGDTVLSLEKRFDFTIVVFKLMFFEKTFVTLF